MVTSSNPQLRVSLIRSLLEYQVSVTTTPVVAAGRLIWLHWRIWPIARSILDWSPSLWYRSANSGMSQSPAIIWLVTMACPQTTALSAWDQCQPIPGSFFPYFSETVSSMINGTYFWYFCCRILFANAILSLFSSWWSHELCDRNLVTEVSDLSENWREMSDPWAFPCKIPRFQDLKWEICGFVNVSSKTLKYEARLSEMWFWGILEQIPSRPHLFN